MEAHLEFGVGLTSSRSDEAIRNTFLGQAHIAGTGPQGRTCRECVHYWPRGYDGEGGITKRRDFAYAGKNGSDAMHLQDARCNKVILNKADNVFPHCAKACRFFEVNSEAPPATRPRLNKRKAAERDAA